MAEIVEVRGMATYGSAFAIQDMCCSLAFAVGPLLGSSVFFGFRQRFLDAHCGGGVGSVDVACREAWSRAAYAWTFNSFAIAAVLFTFPLVALRTVDRAWNMLQAGRGGRLQDGGGGARNGGGGGARNGSSMHSQQQHIVDEWGGGVSEEPLLI